MSPDEKQIRYRLKKNQRFNSVCNLWVHARQPYTYAHTHTSSAIQIHTISNDVDVSMYIRRNTITKKNHMNWLSVMFLWFPLKWQNIPMLCNSIGMLFSPDGTAGLENKLRIYRFFWGKTCRFVTLAQRFPSILLLWHTQFDHANNIIYHFSLFSIHCYSISKAMEWWQCHRTVFFSQNRWFDIFFIPFNIPEEQKRRKPIINYEMKSFEIINITTHCDEW